MKRNLKFWTQYTWETGSIILGMAAIFSLFALFGAEGLDLSLFASTMPYFLCFSAIFTMLMISIGSQTLYVPLLLSMGELRRNVLLGFQYYRFLIIVVTTALCSLIWLLVPGEVSASGLRSIPTILCILTLTSSAWNIMATLFIKWKWAGFIIMLLMFGCAGGIAGYTGVTIAKGFSLGDTAEMLSYLEKLPKWLLAAAFGVLALEIIFQWLLLRRREVKL